MLKNTLIKMINKVRNQSLQKQIVDVMQYGDFVPVENQPPENLKKIAFVIPDLIPYGGGITSVLRIGSYLAQKGLEVFYICYGKQSGEQMASIGRLNYPQYQGTMLARSELGKIAECDAVIATTWRSAYYIKPYQTYKLYFIQDFEPYFHQYGELYLLAGKSYEFGYHMISLGGWNKYKIERESASDVPLKIDQIDFPYEASEYHFKEKNFDEYRTRKEFTLAVYIKEMPRRLPNLIQVLLMNMVRLFEKDGISFHVKFYGLDKKEKVLVGENLGKLNKKELESLYHEADFGMVASFSNISLVPYEMIACGLPIIEFQDGTFPFFFGDHAAIMTTGSYEQLYREIKASLENPQQLEKMQKNARSVLEKVSWKETCEQFYEIIKSIEKKEN